ncbi:MAG: septum formation protein Maf [Chloroflexi bacterium]|nr:septum formation protein Maf [Chloroflexota bacterium]
MRLVLASASARRRELLSRLGIPFVVCPVAVDETVQPEEAPDWAARRLALAKALAASPGGPGLYLGADTVVVLDGRALGKPRTAAEAVEMLKALRGRCHAVITGLALIERPANRGQLTSVRTTVTMREYGDADIAAYVATGLPLDRAGAYGIQDLPFAPVAGVEGCRLNVVGLPLGAVRRLLEG